MNERKTRKSHNRKKERIREPQFTFVVVLMVTYLDWCVKKRGWGRGKGLVLVFLFFHCCFSFADEDDDDAVE